MIGGNLGIKINKLDALAARGYNRSRIASRAIEAYLIQVYKTIWLESFIKKKLMVLNKLMCFMFFGCF